MQSKEVLDGHDNVVIILWHHLMPFNGYVTEYNSVKLVVDEFSRQTGVRYNLKRKQGSDFGSKELKSIANVRYNDVGQHTVIPTTGLPFAILGVMEYDCHLGSDKDFHRKRKRREKLSLEETMATLKLHSTTPWCKRKKRDLIKEQFQSSCLQMEKRFYILLPRTEHHCHSWNVGEIDPTSPFVSPPSHETDERIASQQDHDAAMRMEIEMEGNEKGSQSSFVEDSQDLEHDDKDTMNEITDGQSYRKPSPLGDHDYVVTDPVRTTELRAAKEYIETSQSTIGMLRTECFCLETFRNNPELVRFYTGFKDYNHFRAAYLTLKPTAEKILTWHLLLQTSGQPKISENKFQEDIMPLIDQFCMFMCFVRQGFREQDLAVRFQVNQATVHRMLTTWANYLYHIFGTTHRWPSKSHVQETMPECFAKLYPNARVILDCVELKTQTSDSPFANSCLYSSYNSTTTLQGIIGITPGGEVSFVSSLFAGPLSQKELTYRSGVLHLLNDGDGVMADPAFVEEEELSKKGATLIIPPFRKDEEKVSLNEEDQSSQDIDCLRIHVERAMSRVCDYHIFDGVIPRNLVGIVKQLWSVCCVLTNLKGSHI